MNKQTIIISAFILVVVSIGIGFLIGSKAVVTPQEITRQQVLTEIDKRVAEKIEAGTLPLFVGIIDEEITRERTHLSGEVIAPEMKANRFNIKVHNHFEGGSFTEFLFQPTYFTKEIIVDQNTIIRKTVFPDMPMPMMTDDIPEMPMPDMYMPDMYMPDMYMPDMMYMPGMPEERELTIDQLREEITRVIQVNQLMHLHIETREPFVFGKDKQITASSISFHQIPEMIEMF